MIFLIYDDILEYEFDKVQKIKIRKIFYEFAQDFKNKNGSKHSQFILDNAYNQLEKKYDKLFDNEEDDEE